MEDNQEETFEDVLFYYQTFGLELFTAAAREKGYALTEAFTLVSLADLERYIGQEKVTHTSPDDQQTLEFIRCYYYLGEVFRTNFGGYWKENDRDPESIHSGQPVLAEYRNANGAEFCPRLQVIAAILGRLKNGLRHSVERAADASTASA